MIRLSALVLGLNCLGLGLVPTDVHAQTREILGRVVDLDTGEPVPDATITVRVPRPTRRRLERLARREGRSLSQQVERLIERGLEGEEGAVVAADEPARLGGLLAREPAAEYGDFRAVRTLLSASLPRSDSRRGSTGR